MKTKTRVKTKKTPEEKLEARMNKIFGSERLLPESLVNKSAVIEINNKTAPAPAHASINNGDMMDLEQRLRDLRPSNVAPSYNFL